MDEKDSELHNNSAENSASDPSAASESPADASYAAAAVSVADPPAAAADPPAAAESPKPLLCPVCKTVLPDDSQFCQYCGASLQAPAAAKEESPAPPSDPVKKKKPGARVIIFLSIVVACLVLGLIFSIPIRITDNFINKIGTVSMDSKAAIEAAEGQYNRLIGLQKQCVSNSSTLTDDRAAYDTLVDEVEHTDYLISSIGQVSADNSQTLIQAARTAYDALSDSQKSYVKNSSLLEQREAEYQKFWYDKIMELYNKGSYDAAKEAIPVFLKDFPDSSHIGDLKKLLVTVNEKCAEELIDKANSYYKDKKYEQALNTLGDCMEEYSATDAVANAKSLQEKINQTVADLRPKTGKVLSNTLGSGNGELIVKFDESGDSSGDEGNYDYCIKVQSTDNENEYKMFYIRAGGSATINIPDGTYCVKYAIGSTWYGTDALFGTNTAYARADDTFDFSTSYDSRYVYYDTWTLTVGNVKDGNLSFTVIDASKF